MNFAPFWILTLGLGRVYLSLLLGTLEKGPEEQSLMTLVLTPCQSWSLSAEDSSVRFEILKFE